MIPTHRHPFLQQQKKKQINQYVDEVKKLQQSFFYGTIGKKLHQTLATAIHVPLPRMFDTKQNSVVVVTYKKRLYRIDVDVKIAREKANTLFSGIHHLRR